MGRCPHLRTNLHWSWHRRRRGPPALLRRAGRSWRSQTSCQRRGRWRFPLLELRQKAHWQHPMRSLRRRWRRRQRGPPSPLRQTGWGWTMSWSAGRRTSHPQRKGCSQCPQLQFRRTARCLHLKRNLRQSWCSCQGGPPGPRSQKGQGWKRSLLVGRLLQQHRRRGCSRYPLLQHRRIARCQHPMRTQRRSWCRCRRGPPWPRRQTGWGWMRSLLAGRTSHQWQRCQRGCCSCRCSPRPVPPHCHRRAHLRSHCCPRRQHRPQRGPPWPHQQRGWGMRPQNLPQQSRRGRLKCFRYPVKCRCQTIRQRQHQRARSRHLSCRRRAHQWRLRRRGCPCCPLCLAPCRR
mmetsp:Transcript_118883/g.331642  ORF Transcript_118883/g.331642 Transcript_118883/m.331642 type:complete len:346 (+) Transcript_118883:552-1589(+)